MPNNIFSFLDYLNGFKAIPIAPHHLRMLQINYRAPNRTITAKRLARAMDYPNYNSANLHYGKLGRLIGVAIRWKPLPDQKIETLVDFHRISNEWHWELKKEVALALEKLGWVDKTIAIIPEEIEDTQNIYEGAINKISVNAYERSSIARERCILNYGCKCSICGITLADVYGEIAQGFIHVHHLKPIAEINAKYQIDPILDLRPVCPNCHAIIHLKKPPCTIEAAKRLITKHARY